MSIAEKFDGLNDLIEEIKEFDFDELSVDNIGSWPDFIKVAVFLITFVGVITAGYYFLISDLILTSEQAQQKEQQLKTTFERKAFQAANLQAYRDQMVEMEESFGALVSQLPSDTEVPGLLEDITKKGELSGLAIKSIDLDNEVSKEFYVQLPIDIVVKGNYHDMGAFVSGVAGLPRIVTLTDFTIKPIKGNGRQKGSSGLEMAIKAYTYRYKEIQEPRQRRTSRS